ncbi:hypothetical protein EVG20_g3926, partial [Dentipellis fragilis]
QTGRTRLSRRTRQRVRTARPGVAPGLAGAPAAPARMVSYRTSVVKNNGFNPVWEEALSLPFDCVGDMRELVFVRFAVKEEGEDEKEPLAVYCISLGSLQEALAVPLLDALRADQHSRRVNAPTPLNALSSPGLSLNFAYVLSISPFSISRSFQLILIFKHANNPVSPQPSRSPVSYPLLCIPIAYALPLRSFVLRYLELMMYYTRTTAPP